MRKFVSFILTSTFLASVAVQPVLADEWRWHGDIHHFHEYDYDHWREGRWFQGPHEGRNGWWWIVGGFWYYYPAPVYPYPDPYTPPVIAVQPAPVVPGPAPPTYVYYCRRPAGYYPYVPQCFGHWHRIVSTTIIAPPVGQPPIIVQAPQPAPMPPVSAPAGSQREADDRQLNAYAVELQNIDLKDSRHARNALKTLENQVEAFRQALYQRNYNAMDILKDAEDLQHRIAAQREKLFQHTSTPPSNSVVPTPNAFITSPPSPPPSAPPFPPQ